ncbi:hypothetical protein VNO78_14938 [Psophocarpus tetragonolobus]|uniref:Uncharacterized protein n=1 Tax=Psophocarpus tetragonolobus TaxID=3891 RepID=A0AAN9XJ62_PSOTE
MSFVVVMPQLGVVEIVGVRVEVMAMGVGVTGEVEAGEEVQMEGSQSMKEVTCVVSILTRVRNEGRRRDIFVPVCSSKKSSFFSFTLLHFYTTVSALTKVKIQPSVLLCFRSSRSRTSIQFFCFFFTHIFLGVPDIQEVKGCIGGFWKRKR